MKLVPKRIAQLGRVVTGKTPKTSRQEFFGGEYPFVTPSDLDYDHYYCRSTERSVTDSAKAALPNQFIPAEAVMFTCIGATIGKCALAPTECLTNQQINSVIANADTDPKFLYYLLCHSVDVVKGLGGGAATPIVSKSKFEGIELFVPKYRKQQEAISSVLSSYDVLMENNNQRMKLLEEAVRFLYEEWFVRLRFPGRAHTKIDKGVPTGWSECPVPEVIYINPSTKLSAADEHWHVEMSDLKEGSMVIQQASLRPGRSGSKFQNGDTLFARITPCLENGKTGFVNFLEEGETAKGSTVFIVLRAKKLTPEFVYCLSRTYDFRENAIKSMVGSSGRQRVQESCFEKFMVLVPPKSLLEVFNQTAVPIFQQIKVLHSQSQKLRIARDLLLPRLMSGEIAV